jgi:pre-rRNA-processing protein TSR1
MKRVKRVPKGTSAYQAAWILDDDEDEVDSQFDTEDDEEDYEDAPQEEHTVDTDDVAMDDDESVMGMDDAQEQERQLQQYLAERSTRHLEQLEFPDEVDTPIDVPARTRFQKYRGLESFRTSAWDPYENLPLDYGRIFQFENYKRTRARVLQQSTEEGVMPNTPITLYISNVPRQLVESSTTTPFYVYGLHQHEHKMSVVHFVIQRDAEYEGIIKSKDPLMLQYGCRRYRVQPLYSEHARGGGKGENNVHKFERFLQPNATVVCTVYAPITFGKQVPVLLYTDSTVPKLVASGALLRVEPERILAKRIILTGHPFKVHKRTAVVRYMFFQPEDIVWFKPVQLVTKHGRLGHIYESLGTHGYMKCRFDGGIKQHDTICMRLYKRVFPKWTTVLWQPNFEGMDIE